MNRLRERWRSPLDGTRPLRCPKCGGITVLRDAFDHDYGPGQPRQQWYCAIRTDCGWHQPVYDGAMEA